ncbi:MAG: hybrid sensor histidine kinase/response regulator [Gemmatirosa sp.]
MSHPLMSYTPYSPPRDARRDDAHPLSSDRFFAVAPDLLCVLGGDGDFRRVNPAMERLLGESGAALLGRPFQAFVHPDDRDTTEVAWAHATSGTGVDAFECRVRAADGAHRWVSWRVTPPDAERLVYAVGRDVTARHRPDDAQRQSEELLRFVLESGRMAVWDWDVVAQRATYGDGIGPLLGRPRGWQPTPDDDFPMRIHPDDRAAFLAESYRGMAEGIATTIQCRVDLPDGALRWILSHGEPARDPSTGAVVRFRGVIIDVTERVLLESRLRDAQKMEAVGQLAGGIAHDFNNLLTIITGCGDLALDALPPHAPVRADVDEMLGAAMRGAELVRQLLAFGRRQHLRPEALSLHALLEERAPMFARMLGERHAVRLDLAPDAGAVLVDPGQLDQVLLNLVLNARDAMADQCDGTLTLGTRRVVEQGVELVALIVRDTGAGIDAAEQARIFEPFFTTKPIGRGSGLGLATVHGIVAQSGGSVAVSSTPGGGATFTVHLPAAPRAPERVVEPAHAAAPPPPLSDVTVLLAEDEPMVRRAVRRVLERQGCTVLEATDGGDALRVHDACGGAVDLLLTDVTMPGMGGAELASQLRTGRPDLPVILMSGYAEDADIVHALAGAAAFLAKPFATDALTRTVLALRGPARRARA